MSLENIEIFDWLIWIHVRAFFLLLQLFLLQWAKYKLDNFLQSEDSLVVRIEKKLNVILCSAVQLTTRCSREK